jgi:hypothetical protein
MGGSAVREFEKGDIAGRTQHSKSQPLQAKGVLDPFDRFSEIVMGVIMATYRYCQRRQRGPR